MVTCVKPPLTQLGIAHQLARQQCIASHIILLDHRISLVNQHISDQIFLENYLSTSVVSVPFVC